MYLIDRVIHILTFFCLLYENVMIKLCNIQSYVFVFQNLVAHIKERI